MLMVCVECGDDLVAEEQSKCLECLEANTQNKKPSP
jgi:hypothetical protein